MQENRSFNNLFYGYPGAKTVTHGMDSENKRVKLIPVVLEIPWDINHGSSDFFAACNGTGSIPGTNCRMNGFDKELVSCGRLGGRCPNKHPQYAFVPHSETKPYFDIAQQYVLADRMYASNFDSSSFVSHQYIIAGQAQSSVDYPFGSAWGCPGGPNDKINIVGPERQVPDGQEVVCWDPTTLGDELDAAGISWAYYAGAIGHDGEVLVLDMGDPVRIADVARQLASSRTPEVGIVFTGLRAGEKLHEALFCRNEAALPTEHPLIRLVDVPPLAPSSNATAAYETSRRDHAAGAGGTRNQNPSPW